MSRVEIKSRLIDDTAVLYPGTYLNQLRGEAIESRCLELLSEGVRSVIINFEGTELINSIGISILIGVIESVREQSGKLLLSNLSPSNRELFDVLGLLSQVELSETEEEALSQFCSLTGAAQC
ncbi:MAG: hypothetical protein DMF61_05610 [Blastocatellia bacterium AA13]|nr:MAG: hypothetical protein DMF61_05610 [Blastocatellia bacterium AA13]